jgi:acyl carrier protein
MVKVIVKLDDKFELKIEIELFVNFTLLEHFGVLIKLIEFEI